MDRSRLEQLVVQWRMNAQGCGRRDQHPAGTWRSCARELESLLKDNQGQAVAWAFEGEIEATRNLLQRGLADGQFTAHVRGPEPNNVALYTAPHPAKEFKCETCRDVGMIGGPSYREPDEGGVDCPDCGPSPPDAVQLEKRARALLADAFRNGGYPHAASSLAEGRTDSLDECALEAIRAALSTPPEPQRQAQGEVPKLGGDQGMNSTPHVLLGVAQWHRRMNLELSGKGDDWAAKEMWECPHGRFATNLEALLEQANREATPAAAPERDGGSSE